MQARGECRIRRRKEVSAQLEVSKATPQMAVNNQ
jgi:hypothetical protein